MKVFAAESIEIKEVYCADAVDQLKMQIADEDASLRKYDQNIINILFESSCISLFSYTRLTMPHKANLVKKKKY